VATAPDGIRLVVVVVETDQPGLVGLGCATFNQRPLAVIEAVNQYLDPFAKGYRHVRIQLGGYGSAHLSSNADFRDAGFGLPVDQHMFVLVLGTSTSTSTIVTKNDLLPVGV
jgi:L-alanine-DL-glutamate epimerase-like enolase superfamily enzyme